MDDSLVSENLKGKEPFLGMRDSRYFGGKVVVKDLSDGYFHVPIIGN